MSDQTSSECPAPGVLAQFLRGKLAPPQLDHCESHLKDCRHCHETLVGLNVDDTLTERLVEVLQHDDSENLEEASVEASEDSAEIQNLLDRLTSDDFKRSAMEAGLEGGHRGRTAKMEIVADRAAEILRCVTPDDDSLGILGDYKLIRLIGAGSTGVVFQALDQTLGRTVALKVLRPSLGKNARTRFLTEAKLAASIEHVNVVTIFQVGEVDRLAFMAMQWMPGQTLESLLASGEPLGNDQIIEITQQVATGLHAAHQKQLVHRDIKPANLWICEEDQQLKILDFGLARINDGNDNLTATGMLAGTPGFMSPEQTRGLDLDGRSDLFSLGCVMYRLLSGQLPFEAPTILATLSLIQTDHPAVPAQINRKADHDLSDLAMCLLEKRPEDRPRSATQVVELLTTPREQWPLKAPTHTNSSQYHAANDLPQTAAMAANGSGRKWSNWSPAMIGLLMLASLGWWFAPQIIRIATDQGEIVIAASDDNVEVQVLQGGKVVRVIDTRTQQAFSLKSGQYSFNAVAADSAEPGEKGNSFTIEPATLTMKRGETEIVKVTVKPKKSADPQGTSIVKSEPAIRDKPVYEGNTFDQWINILRSNRDYKAQSRALESCLAIMETEQEQRQILDGTRVFINSLESKFGPSAERLLGSSTFSERSLEHQKYIIGREKKKTKLLEEAEAIVSHHEFLLRVLNSCDSPPVFDFLKAEIECGTDLSQQVLFNWLSFFPQKALVFSDRYTELADPLAENFNQPLVRAMANAVLPACAARQRESLTRFQGSALGIRLKEFVQTANPEQRIDVLAIAFAIFPDDQQILQAYQKDLLDPELNQVFYTLDPSDGCMRQVRYVLLSFMTRYVSNKNYYESPDVDQATRSQRLATAADWLAKTVDGLVADGKRKLLFQSEKFFYLRTHTLFDKSEVTEEILQSFCDIGNRNRDQKILQLLLSKLEKLKEPIEKERENGELDDYEKNEISRILADLDYVIAVFQGKTPAELPPNSKLKIDAAPEVTSVVKNEPATKDKPVYEGNTFDQWMNVLRSNRDHKAQSRAFEACLELMETEREQKEILDGARVFMKTLESKFGSAAFSKASLLSYQRSSDVKKDRPLSSEEQEAAFVHFHGLLLRVLESCDESLVFHFFKAEIEGETRLSQQVLWNWLRFVEIGRTSRSVVFDRYAELIDTFAENFEKPLVRAMAEYVIPGCAARKNDSLTRLQGLNLGIEVKGYVQTATPEQRLEVLQLAFAIFPDDQQVLHAYQKDLLDPKLNDLFAKRSSFSGQSMQAKYHLVQFMIRHISKKEYYESPNVDATTKQRRLATAADWLSKFIDGHLATRDQRLILTHSWVNNRDGTRDITAFDTVETTEYLLQGFYDVGGGASDQTIKQLLLTRLEKLKESIVEEGDEKELRDYEEEKRTRVLADLDYVIAVFQNNTPAELPQNSRLRVRENEELE